MKSTAIAEHDRRRWSHGCATVPPSVLERGCSHLDSVGEPARRSTTTNLFHSKQRTREAPILRSLPSTWTMTSIFRHVLLGMALAAPTNAAERLTLQRDNDVVTVEFSGRTAMKAIPSWKAVLRRDDGGNITALHVPADSPISVAHHRRFWPVTLILGRNGHGHPGTESRGRESFASFPVTVFEVKKETAGEIVVAVSGTSPHAQFKHARTYTFRPEGIEMDGSAELLMELERLGLWTAWNRSQLAGGGSGPLPVRSQGQSSWTPLATRGHDRGIPLPPGVAYPLEVDLALARPVPTFVKICFDRNFESVAASRALVYNVKEQHLIVAMVAATSIPAGQTQTYRYRFEFETR